MQAVGGADKGKQVEQAHKTVIKVLEKGMRLAFRYHQVPPSLPPSLICSRTLCGCVVEDLVLTSERGCSLPGGSTRNRSMFSIKCDNASSAIKTSRTSLDHTTHHLRRCA
jgi:hypothetical protein